MSPVDIEKFIDAAPVSRFQWQAIAVCMAIGLLDGADVQLMGVAAPALLHEWSLSAKTLGPVFMAAPAGMIAGAFIFGPLADRLGRKWPVVFGTALFGLLTLAAAHAQDLNTLIWLRFVAGIGFGGVLPNLIALVNELSPQRLRGRLTAVAFCGLPLGSLLGGLLAHWLIPAHGWRSLFQLGGVAPLVVAGLAIVLLPESIRYLLLRPARHPEVARMLRRIAPSGVAPPSLGTAHLAKPVHATPSWRALLGVFGPRRTSTTLVLALSVGMHMFLLYFFINWTPTLLHEAGMTQSDALLALVLVNTGGSLGAFCWAMLMDRFGAFRVMSCVGVAAALAIVLIGVGHASPLVLKPALFVTGFCVLGAQIGNYALVAPVYPTALRSTGVGTVLGLGRLGSLLGPMAGAWMLGLGWSVEQIFAVVALPGLVAAAGIWIAGRLPRDFDEFHGP